MNGINVAITGAAGQIAYQLIFSLLKGEVFGDQVVNLRLIDIDSAQSVLTGVKMEIEDCAFPCCGEVDLYTDIELSQGFLDIDFAFLIGASPRKAGMERADLLASNGEIFKAQGQALMMYAKPSVKVLVVGNPCNTNCYIAMHHAKGLDPKNFYAMTMLDEHRARKQIALKIGRSVEQVKCYIYGNHSATQYPDFENCSLSNDASFKLDLMDPYWQNVFVPMIQTRGAEVIKARGASSAASAAHAAIKTAYCIVHQSKEPFSVAKVSKGEYGSPEGLIVSLPSYFDNGVCQTVLNYQHSVASRALIERSFQELVAEVEQVKIMGLLND